MPKRFSSNAIFFMCKEFTQKFYGFTIKITHLTNDRDEALK
jgi:hypothetical protein